MSGHDRNLDQHPIGMLIPTRQDRARWSSSPALPFGQQKTRSKDRYSQPFELLVYVHRGLGVINMPSSTKRGGSGLTVVRRPDVKDFINAVKLWAYKQSLSANNEQATKYPLPSYLNTMDSKSLYSITRLRDSRYSIGTRKSLLASN